VLNRLDDLKREALQELAAAGDAADLESWRIAFLGRKGALTNVLRSLGDLPKGDRPAVGKKGNLLKQALEAAFAERCAELERAAIETDLAAAALDVTLPGRQPALGRLHPSTHGAARNRHHLRRYGLPGLSQPRC